MKNEIFDFSLTKVKKKYEDMIHRLRFCSQCRKQLDGRIQISGNTLEEVRENSKDFFRLLANVMQDTMIDENALFSVFLDDVILYKMYRKEVFGLKGLKYKSNETRNFSDDNSERYSYHRLLNYTSNRFPDKSLNDFHKGKANLFAETYNHERLFPFFVFAQLVEPKSTKKFLTWEDEGRDDSPDLSWLIDRIKEKGSFGHKAKQDDFIKSMALIQLFYFCMTRWAYENSDEDIEVFNIGVDDSFSLAQCSGLPDKLACDLLSDAIYGTFDDLKLNQMGPQEDSALNLYCFNDATMLLDWMYAIKARNPITLRLTNMLFVKALPFPWLEFSETEREDVARAFCQIFDLLMIVTPWMEENPDEQSAFELENLYDESVEKANGLKEEALHMMIEMTGFHYYYGQLMLFDKKTSNLREDPQKVLYKEMIAREKKRQPSINN